MPSALSPPNLSQTRPPSTGSQPALAQTSNYWYWSLNSNDPSSGIPGVQSLSAIDPFINWQALTATDFRKIYGYELVITKGTNVIANFSFPIAPTHISMSTTTASSVSATMKGIVEDNNGAPFRDINISGTTGVLPSDTLATPKSASNSVLNYLFKNTIQAVQGVVSSVNSVANALTGSAASYTSKINFQVNGTDDVNAANGSGYAFFHNLARFLDYYVALKKTKAGAPYRLSFHMHKDQMYFDVLLTNWGLTKAAGTIEYNYNISLKAYRRKPQPKTAAVSQQNFTQASRLNALASVFNALTQARLAVSASAGVLAGISADVNDSFFQPLREVCLLISDGLGLVNTMANMPATILAQLNSSMTYDLAQRYSSPNSADFISQVNAITTSQNLYGLAPGQSIFQSAATANATDGQADLASRPPTSNPSPLAIIFANPNSWLALFDLFPLSQLQIPPIVTDAINAEINRVRSLTNVDLRMRRDMVQAFAETVSESFGGGSATYNRVMGLPPPTPTTQVLSTDSIALLSNLNDVVQSLDQSIVIMENADPNPNNDYYNFYADYAVANGINFTTSQSKFFIPFQYGASLESIAFQYLGDPDRWIELAALNALQEPYIDETGFTIPLLGSSTGNTIIIANATNLYIGQVVTLSSNTVNPQKFQIATINVLSPTQTVIGFTYPSNVSAFKVSDSASVLAYLPNTVNSNMVIAIPAPSAPNIGGIMSLYPTVADLTGIARMAKVDFLLQSNGDLAFSAGDVKLASGLANLVQAATMKVMTPLNSLLQHLGYGNPIQAGTSVADFSAQSALQLLNQQFALDPRFNGVAASQITAQGPFAQISLVLNIADTQVLLPLSANLPL